MIALASRVGAAATMAVLFLGFGVAPVSAAEITVTHYGTSMYGVPYAVAKQNDLFKAAGMPTPGFLTSEGGGTSVRNTLAADIPYGEVATAAAIAAIKQGLPITIVNSGVNTVGDILWIARKDDTRPMGPKDLDGMTIGYSSPKGGSDMVLSDILRQTGSTAQKRTVGGAGSSLTALRQKAVDITWTQEPIWSREKDNFRLVFNSADFIPQVSQTVGIVRTDYLRTHPDTIRSIIEARRQAVDLVYQDKKAAADATAREYKMDPALLLSAINTVATVKGVNYWSRGDIDYKGLEIALKILQSVEAVDQQPVDWAKVVSEDALPADLRKH
ncbi:MAG: ABC transporter substrate-binding protein [Janthinobacterium lividum]